VSDQPATARLLLTRGLWVCLTAVVCLIFGGPFLSTLRPDRDITVDFFQEWASAKNLFNGLPIYTSQRITRERYVGESQGDLALWIEVNAHPPTSILLALPLVGLDYPDAVLAWNLISLAALGVSLLLVLRQLAIPLSFWSLTPLLALLLLCAPLWAHVYYGQLGLVLLLLLVGTWTAERSGKPAWAGALLATATAIKLFPGFLFLYFVVRRQWRAVWAGAAALVGLTLLTAGVLGVDAYRSYVQEVLPQVAWFRVGWNNASLPGFWAKLFDPAPDIARSVWRTEALWQSPPLATAGTFLSCAALTALLAWVIYRARSRSECDRAFGAAITGMLLVSPVVWEHYFVLLLLPVALLGTAFPERILARVLFLVVVIALFFIPPADLQDLVISRNSPPGIATPLDTLTVLSFQLYALLGLFLPGILPAKPEMER
jgi:hypothetical protein